MPTRDYQFAVSRDGPRRRQARDLVIANVEIMTGWPYGTELVSLRPGQAKQSGIRASGDCRLVTAPRQECRQSAA